MSTRRPFEAHLDPWLDASLEANRSHEDWRSDDDSCACGLASDDAPGDVYNEEAFRYFLDVERKRSERSNRPFVLLLVDLKKPSAGTAELDVSFAQKLFSALSVCVRETDFVGWYRARSVAGAVLTQHSDAAGANVQEVVSRRIAQALRNNLPFESAGRVRVRIYQLPSTVQSGI